MSSLMNFYDTFSVAQGVAPDGIPFELEIVSSQKTLKIGLTEIPLTVHRTLDDIAKTDIIIIPTALINDETRKIGRYPAEVKWLKQMHAKGSIVCSACSGALLLAETGLLDGKEATTHWTLEQTFRQNFPNVKLLLERELVVSKDEKLALSGAASAWQDLALYLIARYSGSSTALAVTKYFMFQWHAGGQKPYLTFHEPTAHGDGPVLGSQKWLQTNSSNSSPVEGMIQQSGLTNRSFARRFKKATGYSPIDYVQKLRMEQAKSLIESTNLSLDQISYEIGYEDPSFFRRLFKRIVGIKPIEYRRKFGSPTKKHPKKNTRNKQQRGAQKNRPTS